MLLKIVEIKSPVYVNFQSPGNFVACSVNSSLPWRDHVIAQKPS
jgi:hypothetical protein